jgi:ABC-type amino acid transport substrate-binding protein
MKKFRWNRWLATALVGGVCTAPALSQAQTQTVLERVAAGGKLVLAHREASVPFSYLDADKKPIGYALDLCLKIAEAVRRKTGAKGMAVEYLMVSPADRIEVMVQGKADLECGSTTNNAERREKVAFTIPHFITGARYLVKAGATIDRLEDLQGRKVASTKATTSLKALTQLNHNRSLKLQILEAPDHAKGVDMVESGEADAFAMDDVLLYGLAANRTQPGAFKVVGKFLTTEPLAIMLPRKDVEFKKLVDEEMRRLIYSGEIHQVYDKWFMNPIAPKNIALKMPASYLLRDFWKFPTDQVPF